MAQKFGLTWWGERWLQSLSRIDFSNRLPRGATYARQGAVTSIQIDDNMVLAKVQGSSPRPYSVKITIPKFSRSEVDRLIDEVQANPTLLAQLFNRELNPQIMEIAERLGLLIFPKSWKDFGMDCSCPDWAVPCKHLAAVIYMMSREIDNNPFLIFELHGVDFERELQSRGVAVDTKTVLEPAEWSSCFAECKQKKISSEPMAFQRIDFSCLRDIAEPLANLLAPNPPFYAKSGFLEVYKNYLHRISRQCELILTGAFLFGAPRRSEPLALLRTDGVSFSVDYSGHIAPTLHCIDENDPRAQHTLESLAASVLAIPADYIASYSPSVAALHQTLMAALHLFRRGCVIPQILSVAKGGYIIRWLPSMLDGEVSAVVEALARLTPPDMLQAKFGARKKPVPVENPALHILSWALSQVMVSQLDAIIPDDKIIELFFLNKVLKFQSVGETETPGSIKSWLDCLHLSAGQFPITLFVSEVENGFELGITIGVGQKDQPLQSILTQKKYDAVRFAILKELSLLTSFVSGLNQHINQKAKTPISFTLSSFVPFLNDIIPAMRLLGIRVVLPKALQEIIRPRVSVSITKKRHDSQGFIRLDDLLMFDWQVALGDQLLSEKEFARLIRNATGLIRFKNQYIYVQEADLAKLQKVLASGGNLSSAQLLQAALSESYDRARVELSLEVRSLISELTKHEEIPVPKQIRATLRPYQVRGYAWMYRNMRIGFGSILADDMGLGKTLQVITLLQKIKNDGLITPKTPAIIVVPTGLITNWQDELTRFAPELTQHTYHGAQRDFKQFDADILLTTYGVVRSDISTIKKRKWQVVVIDEAQNIKNAETAQSKAVRSIAAATHIAMSGTPVENRLSEFWSVMEFANKGYLGNIKHFNEHFARPIQNNGDQETATLFRKVTAPFLMRRLKTDKSIISDLPDKIEQNENVFLTSSQASLYEQTLREAMKEIEGVNSSDQKSLFKRQGMVLQMILALKQICNHPALFLKNRRVEPEHSGKTVLLLDLLQSIVESNQKVLVFTQFKEMGDMLVPMIFQRLGEAPLFLHGGCSVKERKNLVDRFQNERGGQVFLLSLKAAGTGLNLTAASHVVHFDLWWNPAVEAQATDRAYRIGQHQNVLVHRFITKNTFEERIDAMIQQKKNLADLTVATGESWIGKLSNEELQQIFRHD